MIEKQDPFRVEREGHIAWLVLNRVRTPGALKDFDVAGYRFDRTASTREVPVFVRSFADRP